MEKSSLKSAINQLQVQVVEINNNKKIVDYMKITLKDSKLRRLSTNIRRGKYSLDISTRELQIVSSLYEGREEADILMHLLTGADERERYFS